MRLLTAVFAVFFNLPFCTKIDCKMLRCCYKPNDCHFSNNLNLLQHVFSTQRVLLCALSLHLSATALLFCQVHCSLRLPPYTASQRCFISFHPNDANCTVLQPYLYAFLFCAILSSFLILPVYPATNCNPVCCRLQFSTYPNQSATLSRRLLQPVNSAAFQPSVITASD